MPKTKIIALRGQQKSGKTRSVINAFEQLKAAYPSAVVNQYPYVKIRATITINGVKVGIDHRGDVCKDIKKGLNDFKEEGCEIIVCACRLGMTQQEVSDFASEHHYQVEWIDKIKVEDEDQFEVANDATAAQIVSAVQTALGA